MHPYWSWFNATKSIWWHDSANPDEIDRAISNGAQGVTTNPVLTYKTFEAHPDFWMDSVQSLPKDLSFSERAEALLKLVACYAADRVLPIYTSSGHTQGFALGQLNPNYAGDAEYMYAQACRLRQWRENVIVKLPASMHGLDVIEKLGTEGANVCATVNVSVAQAVTVAQRYEKACRAAIAKGITPGFCIVVQQVGRVEDYTRLLAQESNVGITQEDIDMSGIIMAKRTISLLPKKEYPHCIVMPGGLRTPMQLAELAGADVTFTLHPRFQLLVEATNMPREERWDRPLPEQMTKRLMCLPEYRKLYEPDGLKPSEFLSFGCFQKVLSHFLESGWARLETYGLQNTLSEHWT